MLAIQGLDGHLLFVLLVCACRRRGVERTPSGIGVGRAGERESEEVVYGGKNLILEQPT